MVSPNRVAENIPEPSPAGAAIAALQAQYETYPYPARDPAEEARRLISGSPSHLDEVNHYVFGGQLDFTKPLRVLVAGGGTGDATVMLAQQMADAGVPGRIDYLDLSKASAAVAQARLAARGLTSVRFHQGSLLELDQVERLESAYDYIDCCGVLHHLDQPAAGLAALTNRLAPGGGIGLMVYAPFGRTGVYPLQAALRTVSDGLEPTAQVALARRLLPQLPRSNWFQSNPHLNDHRQSDAGLFDLLLHSCDRPFTVGELVELAASCGLGVAALIEPGRYRPATYINDPRLLKRLGDLPWLRQAAWAEQISGAITRHIAYLVRPADLERAVARPDDFSAVPVLRELDGPATADALRDGGNLHADLGGFPLSLPMPRLAGPILSRIDGRASLEQIYQAITALDRGRLAREVFQSQFEQIFQSLNGINKLLLRVPR